MLDGRCRVIFPLACSEHAAYSNLNLHDSYADGAVYQWGVTDRDAYKEPAEMPLFVAVLLILAARLRLLVSLLLGLRAKKKRDFFSTSSPAPKRGQLIGQKDRATQTTVYWTNRKPKGGGTQSGLHRKKSQDEASDGL